MKETKTPYQILSTKDEKKEIKKLIHDNKPYGWTNMEFLISLLKNVEQFYSDTETNSHNSSIPVGTRFVSVFANGDKKILEEVKK